MGVAHFMFAERPTRYKQTAMLVGLIGDRSVLEGVDSPLQKATIFQGQGSQTAAVDRR